jgi:hypothetical protein
MNIVAVNGIFGVARNVLGTRAPVLGHKSTTNFTHFTNFLNSIGRNLGGIAREWTIIIDKCFKMVGCGNFEDVKWCISLVFVAQQEVGSSLKVVGFKFPYFAAWTVTRGKTATI